MFFIIFINVERVNKLERSTYDMAISVTAQSAGEIVSNTSTIVVI